MAEQQIKKQKLDHHGDQMVDGSVMHCHGNLYPDVAKCPISHRAIDYNSNDRSETHFCRQSSSSGKLGHKETGDNAAPTNKNQEQTQGATQTAKGPTPSNEILGPPVKIENKSPTEVPPTTQDKDSRDTHKIEALPEPTYENSYAEKLLGIEDELCQSLNHLFFYEPVSHVYNPLIYASETHSKFVRKYCKSTKPILFLGMNPGPYGMAQNGVPFGEVSVTQDWLGITGQVRKPARENPKRPILGFNCTQSEVSGKRFWGLFRNLSKTPETFFKYSYVHNYCPLVFMAASGKNVTPPTIPMIQRMPLLSICDAALCEVIQLLKVKVVVAIGRFVQDRAAHALRDQGIRDVRIEFLMHPSPINAKANKCWNEFAMNQLSELNVLKYLAPAEETQDEKTEQK